jgi:hypothetical protein
MLAGGCFAAGLMSFELISHFLDAATWTRQSTIATSTSIMANEVMPTLPHEVPST